MVLNLAEEAAVMIINQIGRRALLENLLSILQAPVRTRAVLVKAESGMATTAMERLYITDIAFMTDVVMITWYASAQDMLFPA